MDWERIFNNYGWPTLVLVIVALVFWKAIWPRITQYLDDQRAVAEDARLALKNRADKLEEREDTMLTSFKDTLNGVRDALETSAKRDEAQIKLLEQVADGIKTLKRTPARRGK